jgi:hypothetical protein
MRTQQGVVGEKGFDEYGLNATGETEDGRTKLKY